MIEALTDYGLFVAKLVTFLSLLFVLLVMVLRARGGGHGGDRDRIEVVDLNSKHLQSARILTRETRSRKAVSKVLKADKKDEKQRAKSEETRPRVFVVDFEGDVMASEVASLREIITAVIMECDEGDQVVVRIENPGGLVTEHGLAASQLERIRSANIPLTVAVDKVAASGGYLMACVADRIIAAPFAIVGSIGVVAQIPNFHRVLERAGIDYELHTAGEYKRTLTLFGENTDAAREKLREQIEDVHSLFKSFIADYRPGVDLERVATGEYWHARQALELGLIDEVATSDTYLMRIGKDADVYQVTYTTHKKPLERLLSSIEKGLARLVIRP